MAAQEDEVAERRSQACSRGTLPKDGGPSWFVGGTASRDLPTPFIAWIYFFAFLSAREIKQLVARARTVSGELKSICDCRLIRCPKLSSDDVPAFIHPVTFREVDLN